MGVAVLVAPFFLVAHVLALAGAGEADGFSPVHQVASAVAARAYLLAGLVVSPQLAYWKLSTGRTTWSQFVSALLTW